MKTAIMGIGIPGSGKTTLLKQLAEKHGMTYINRDDIREELFGDATNQEHNEQVWLEANLRTATALEEDKGVVLDSTFVEKWKRADMLAFLRDAGADRIIGFYFNVPYETALARNQGRDRVVPEHVLEWMQQQLTNEPPSADEGFDALLPLSELEALAKNFA